MSAMKFDIRPAARERAKLRLGIAGPAGSGKSYTALLIASALGGRVGVIDTEHHSAHLYADLIPGGFDVLDLPPPFSPDAYVAAIHAFELAEVSTIIVDSLSHAWAGEGGSLDIQGKLADKTGNSWAAWRTVTPRHNALVEALLQSPCHIIATMRSKTEYVQEGDSKGKVRKVGLAPVMRDGIEYEFTVFMEMDQTHNAFVGKDRTQLFDNRIIARPDSEMGRVLLDWLNSGVEPEAEPTLREPQLARFARAIEQAQNLAQLKQAYRTAASICDAVQDTDAKRTLNRLTNLRKLELESQHDIEPVETLFVPEAREAPANQAVTS